MFYLLVLIMLIGFVWLFIKLENGGFFSTQNKQPDAGDFIAKDEPVQRISAGEIWIVDREDEYPIAQPFRTTSDGEHIIRYKHKCPPGCHYVAFHEVSVAGVSHPNNASAVLQFFTGSNREVKLRREPNNKFDKNAIEVLGFCDGHSHGRIGYIPKEVAAELAPAMDNGETVVATIKTMFLHRLGFSPGLRIHVWM